MESARNQFLAQISKKMQGYLLEKEIKFNADYLPGALKKEVNIRLRTMNETIKRK